MTNRLDPRHTGPATNPAAEPTPTELLAWLRGREAVVDRQLEAHREGMLRALEVRLEPVTKQLSELQLQADATDRRHDQHIAADQPHSAQSYYTYTSGVERRLEGHIRSVDPHPHAREVAKEETDVLDHLNKIEASFEVVEETVRSLRRDLTHHLDLHEGLGSGKEPNGVMTGPTGDGQSDLTMVKYAMHLGNAHGIFARVAANPDVTKDQFDIAVYEYREQVFEFTRQMRIIVANREARGAQAG